MHACMHASYAVLEVGMDGCILYTGVGSTLWAWYACIVEADTRYICMYATAMLCSIVHLPVGCPLVVLVCMPALLLVARFPGPCLAVARARLSARCAARCPCLSVRPLQLD